MNLTLQSSLLLVPIEIRKDKKHYIVEDKTTGDFYEMPVICIDAIHLINEGMTLGDIEKFLKSKYPHEEVDLVDFAGQLVEMQLIAELDGETIDHKSRFSEQSGFLWVSPKLGTFFFNKVTYFVYVSLFIINLFLFISKPSLIPHYKDLFIFDYMMFNIPAWLLLTFGLVLFHEFGHVLAIRAQNLPTKLEVGHRLFFVVLETDMSSVWKLPSKARNALYLAGLCFDTVMLSIALMCQLLVTSDSEILLGILNVIVLDTFIRMIYQCCIYMKTDLYYLFENLTGCYNLMENAQQLFRKWLPIGKAKTVLNNNVMFDEERKTVLFYTILYLIGVGLNVGLYILYYIPQAVYSLKKVLPDFQEGPVSIPFWDATLFMIQILLGIGLLLYSWRKKYLQN